MFLVMGEDLNGLMVSGPEGLTECTHWEFDTSEFKTTIISELSLIIEKCKKKRIICDLCNRPHMAWRKATSDVVIQRLTGSRYQIRLQKSDTEFGSRYLVSFENRIWSKARGKDLTGSKTLERGGGRKVIDSFRKCNYQSV